MKLFRVFFWGMLISFLGTLPLGTLNVAAMQIGIYEGILLAFLFSLGALLVEMVYVRISLVGIEWVRQRQKLMMALEWVALGIIAILAALNIYAALIYSPAEHPAGINPFANFKINRMLLGMGMSAVNPMQIPFWFAWSAYLFNKNILKPGKGNYNTYIAGIGTGTFMGNAVFILGGRAVAQKMTNNQECINWVIGGLFLIAALVQLIKILKQQRHAVVPAQEEASSSAH